jgi:glycosyltransferase involved in cell wall biosynthesis
MTRTPSLSVVVASHGRPGTLRRCLTALSQSAFARLEVIVVADKEGLEVVARLPFGDRLKTVLQADPNLSKARNDGIAHAAGDIVAFVDDDAVPEPTWAGAIVAAFAASCRHCRGDRARSWGETASRCNGAALRLTGRGAIWRLVIRSSRCRRERC